MEHVFSAQLSFDELHAVSSGATAAFYLAALRAGLPSRGAFWHLEHLVQRSFLAPWTMAAAARAVRAEYERVARLVGEARLDEAVRGLRVVVYSYENCGRRVTDKPETWRDLLAAARRSSSIPLVSFNSSSHLDGVSVGLEELPVEDALWKIEFLSRGEAAAYAFGLLPAASLPVRLRVMTPGDCNAGLARNKFWLLLMQAMRATEKAALRLFCQRRAPPPILARCVRAANAEGNRQLRPRVDSPSYLFVSQRLLHRSNVGKHDGD